MGDLAREYTTQQAVAKILKERQLSNYRMAKDLGRSPNMIDRYLSGKSRMSLSTANKFEELYGLTISDVTRRGQRHENS